MSVARHHASPERAADLLLDLDRKQKTKGAFASAFALLFCLFALQEAMLWGLPD